MSKIFKAFCPLVKGTCLNGYVKGVMPEDAATGERTVCAFFTNLMGKDPQSGETINDPGCAIAFMPIITLEGNQMTRSVAASTDKVATEVRHQHASFVGALPREAQERLITHAPKVIKKDEGG